MPSLPSSREPLPALTGLRFVAAFSVLIGHSAYWVAAFPQDVTWIHYIGQGPALGMPLFFVLSGFVIHYNYGRYFAVGFVNSAVIFTIARFARLYPLYILLLCFYIYQNHAFDQSPFIWFRFLTLSQAWTLTYSGKEWIGHHLEPLAWSISVETLLYLFYIAASASFMRLVRIRHCFAAFTVVWALYYAIVVGAWENFDALRVWGNLAFHVDADPQNALLGWVFNTGPIGRLFEFVLGAIAAQLFLIQKSSVPTEGETYWMGWLLRAAILAATLIYIGARHYSLLAFGSFYAGIMAPFLAITMYCCVRYKSATSRFLSRNWIVALGDASYSIYLLHWFTVRPFGYAITSVGLKSLCYWGLMLCFTTLLTLGLSIFMFAIYEAPCRRLLRHALNRAWLRIKKALQQWAAINGLRLARPVYSLALAMFFVGSNWPRTH
jgi:peptidoglycan/LPS O-acetylase OafA/YrhL